MHVSTCVSFLFWFKVCTWDIHTSLTSNKMNFMENRLERILSSQENIYLSCNMSCRIQTAIAITHDERNGDDEFREGNISKLRLLALVVGSITSWRAVNMCIIIIRLAKWKGRYASIRNSVQIYILSKDRKTKIIVINDKQEEVNIVKIWALSKYTPKNEVWLATGRIQTTNWTRD